MKASRYNRLFQAADGSWLAFNSWSTALATVEPDKLDFVRALLAAPDATPCDTPEKRRIREGLYDARFLVDDELDELAALKSDLARDRFRSDRMDLTIAPTLDCNFRCDYCFEEHLKVSMSRRVQDALLDWIAAHAPATRELNVTWYGGEPLLPRAFPVLERVSERIQELAAEHGTRYAAQVVTNGFFLDAERVERLVALGVNMVQVTLDGPEDMHDARRHLIGGRGTFARVFEHLAAAAERVKVQLRINVDRRNALRALEVVELLRERGLERHVRPYLAMVTHEGAACGNIVEFCYSSADFARMEVEVYREAARRGLALERYPFRIAGAFCTADRANGWVVSPTGALFKCWHEVTMSPERSVGSLLDPQQPFQRANEQRWTAWNPFERSGCRSCDVSPLCHGGCPVEAMKHPESERGACEPYKYELEALLDIRRQRPATPGGMPAARDVACR